MSGAALAMAATTSCVSEDKPEAIAEAANWIRGEVRRQAVASGTPVGEIEVHQFPPTAAPKLLAMGFLTEPAGVLEWLAEHQPAVILTATLSYLPAGAEAIEA